MSKSILVTGGFGFIGSHLVDAYLSLEDVSTVVVYDNLSTGTYENLKHVKDERLVVIEGSILDKAKLSDTVRRYKIGFINHQAAELEVSTGITNPFEDANTNIIGTLNVLCVALANRVKRVFFASSGAVYGEAKYVPVDENHPLEPHWPYGVSKLAAERYVMQYHKLYGLNVSAFRYGIVYGEREWFGRVLTLFIKRIFLEGKPPVIFGDGTQSRDFVYVKDIVRAQMLAMNNPMSNGEVFNLSSGTGVQIRQLAEDLLELSGRRFELIYDNPQEGSASQYQPGRVRLRGELKRFVLDSNKAKRILKWVPETPFHKGVRAEIEWITKNSAIWNVRPRV